MAYVEAIALAVYGSGSFAELVLGSSAVRYNIVISRQVTISHRRIALKQSRDSIATH